MKSKLLFRETIKFGDFDPRLQACLRTLGRTEGRRLRAPATSPYP